MLGAVVESRGVANHCRQDPNPCLTKLTVVLAYNLVEKDIIGNIEKMQSPSLGARTLPVILHG
jgi:hypothetical protein